MKIDRAAARDFPEMMDFMLACYRTVDPKHERFEEIYPDLYQPTEESMGRNFVIRMDRRIVSMVGLFPVELKLDNVRLRVAGIGGVCTASEHRGKGGMTALMSVVREEILGERFPLGWLTGERDRYAHFGWEKAGSDLVIRVRKLKPAEGALEWTIREMDAAKDSLDGVIAARDGLAVKGLCDDDTLRLKLRRKHLKVLGASLGSGFAYAVVHARDAQLSEWGGDPEGVRALIRHAVGLCGGLSVRVPPIRDAYTDVFLSFAQDFGGPTENLAVFDLVALLKAYKTYLASAWPGDQSLRLAVDGTPASSAGIVSGKPVSRAPRDAFLVKLSPRKMASFLFGPLRPSMLLNLPPDMGWLDRVFPMPFTMPSLWRV